VYKGSGPGQAEISLGCQLFGARSQGLRAERFASAAQFLVSSARDLAAALGDQPRRALVAGMNP
jgi:hypothetical protein